MTLDWVPTGWLVIQLIFVAPNSHDLNILPVPDPYGYRPLPGLWAERLVELQALEIYATDDTKSKKIKIAVKWTE